MSDMVTVFNQLTQKELTDYSLFENVLNNHFEKFRYFYRIIKPISLKPVKEIFCECPDHNQSLSITIKFDKKINQTTFRKKLKERLAFSSTMWDGYFLFNVTESRNSINISIENKTISREDEIYEN